jgi:hypothetical protein
VRRDLSQLWYLRDPQAWRNRAEMARLAADVIGNTAIKEHQRKRAESYERLARYAEERLAAERQTQAGSSPNDCASTTGLGSAAINEAPGWEHDSKKRAAASSGERGGPGR